MSKVPILFIIFNRPEISLESFNQIRKYQPTELYIAADGPQTYGGRGAGGAIPRCEG